MEKTFVVYKHQNKINGKRYYGITCQRPQDRWRNNGKAYKGSPKFYKAIQKYGWNNFEHIILIHGLTVEQAKRWESKLILFYKTNEHNTGYNLTNGGEFNWMTPEVKQKISKTQKERMTPEFREHLRQLALQRNLSKENNGFYGKHHTDASKQQMSKNHWSKTNPQVFYNVVSVQRKGANNPNAKQVIRLLDNKIYDCIQDCYRDNKINAYTVTKHCQNKVKNPRFMYLKDWIKIHE